MKKYWVNNVCDNECCIHCITAKAAFFHKVNAEAAATVYTLLHIHADNISLEYDENSDIGKMYKAGLEDLEEMEFIGISKECEIDGYETIYIVR